MFMPSGGKAGSGVVPAAASSVGSQSIEIVTWVLVVPGAQWPGQRTIAGIRRPPSRSSVFRPVNGQVSANRSPPLSLVKITIVSSAMPARSSASSTRPTCRSRSSTIAR